jgi:PTS system cellobiose-specific IIC component
MPSAPTGWVGQHYLGYVIGLVVAEMFTFIIRRNWVIPAGQRSGLGFTFIFGVDSGLPDPLHHGDYLLGATNRHNFHQIIMDSISTPLASMGSVVGWAYVIFNSCCGSSACTVHWR